MSDDRPFLEKLSRFGKVIFSSGLTDFIPGGTLAGNLAKAAGKILGVNDPETIAEMIEQGLPSEQAGEVRRAMADEVIAYQATLQEKERTEQATQQAVTARHAADMLSDSVLSKNIRPGMCIALNAAAVLYSYGVFVLFVIDYFTQTDLAPSFWQNELARTALVSLWSAATGYNLFYVGGRTFEKRGSWFAAVQSTGKS